MEAVLISNIVLDVLIGFVFLFSIAVFGMELKNAKEAPKSGRKNKERKKRSGKKA